jgi:glutamine synthetase
MGIDFSDIQALIHDRSIQFIRFEQSDTHGLSRSKTVPVRHAESYLQQGINFPLPPLGQDVQGFPASNTGYIEELGFPDVRLQPDLNTFQILPWSYRTARVLCEPYFLDGRPVMGASRQLARSLLNQLEQMGYRLLSGFEYEFCLVDRATHQPITQGIQNFAPLGLKFDEELVYRIVQNLVEVGIDITTINSEHGPGQIEINYSPAWGIDAADQAFTFKNGVKEMLGRSSSLASFMTRPAIDHCTNGCHYNQSLWDGNRSVFFNPDSPDGISSVCRNFLAGQLTHAPALCALAAPTINCYKRFHSSSVTPSRITWGINTRTAALRVKAFPDQRLHIENRLAGGAANPYLLMAGCVAAGIDGIQRKLTLPDVTPQFNHAPQVPLRLENALDALEQDVILREMLGTEFIQLFVALKRHEIAKARGAIGSADTARVANYDDPEFLNNVDEWEQQEFFEVL